MSNSTQNNAKHQLAQLKEGALTVPNLLSLIRILLVPAFLVLFLKHHYYLALLMIALSGLSDFLDGKIARKFNQISNLGKLLDPLADKLTQIALAIAFFFDFHASPDALLRGFSGFFWFFVAKELLMLIGASVMMLKDITPSAAIMYGKVSTFAYYLVMLALLCFAQGFGAFSRWATLPSLAIVIMVSISIVLTLIAFCAYAPGAIKQLRGARDQAPEKDTAEKK